MLWSSSRSTLPRPRAQVLCALLLAALAPACLSSRRAVAPTWPALEPAELGTMSNVSVTAGIWAGGLPEVDDLALARRRGVTRVISLCEVGVGEEAGLPEACAELGLTWHAFGPEPGKPLADESVVRVLNLLGDPDGPPTLIFCEDGTRTAFVLAVHRMVHERCDPDAALRDARRSGLGEEQDAERARDLAARLGA